MRNNREHRAELNQDIASIETFSAAMDCLRPDFVPEPPRAPEWICKVAAGVAAIVVRVEDYRDTNRLANAERAAERGSITSEQLSLLSANNRSVVINMGKSWSR